jgi:hypothetical protein
MIKRGKTAHFALFGLKKWSFGVIFGEKIKMIIMQKIFQKGGKRFAFLLKVMYNIVQCNLCSLLLYNIFSRAYAQARLVRAHTINDLCPFAKKLPQTSGLE